MSSAKRSPRAKILKVKPAGPAHQVVETQGAGTAYRRAPCSDWPWRVDAVGVFPPEAFRHSANTAYDLSEHRFACHQVGARKPAICAGFLLRGADHNLAVRLGRLRGVIQNDVSDEGLVLHEDYKAMAIANGVSPDDPVLKPCRMRQL